MTRRHLLAVPAALLLALPAALPAQAATSLTGRLLVTLDDPPSDSRAARAAAVAVQRLDGVRRDGAQAPQIGLISVRPVGGLAASLAARALRRLPGVRHVEAERRHELRVVPNDPALITPEPAAGTPAGTALQWWQARQNMPAAWDVTNGAGATVAVIDTGADGQHPDLAGKIAGAIDNDATPGRGPATSDENGHGTHVASIACAAGGNGYGIVGAGLDCRLLIVKSDLSDGSVARSIVQAADAGVDAISMSFGTDGTSPPVRAIVDAIDYAVARDIVLVASAADRPVEEQGDPANLLQPTGSGADVTAGRGLSITAAQFAGTRADFAGRGSQISLAAYGSFSASSGPSGIFAAFPANTAEIEVPSGGVFPRPGCNCRTMLNGDRRFAYLEGTSMATPMVAATAALARALNPDARAADVIRIIKQTAQRPAGQGWNAELGWGILDAGAALQAVRQLDRRAPSSQLTGRTRVRRARSFSVRWTGGDAAPAGLTPSGIAHYDVFRSANGRPYRRIKRTTATRLKLRVKAGSRYRFYTIAVDRAGNREPVPPRPDLRTRVDRARGR